MSGKSRRYRFPRSTSQVTNPASAARDPRNATGHPGTPSTRRSIPDRDPSAWPFGKIRARDGHTWSTEDERILANSQVLSFGLAAEHVLF